MSPELFDLHCDTLTVLYGSGADLSENTHHISLARAAGYARYSQIMAVWSDKNLSDEAAFFRYREVLAYARRQWEINRSRFSFVTSGDEYAAAKAAHGNFGAAFLAVEDARLLAGDLSRLDGLRGDGVRFLTPVWGGESCIGGAHDTGSGLTDFGRAVVARCFSLGVIPDLSHASEKTADEILSMAKERGKPVLATHSDSYSVCPHSRNLRDRDFARIRALGGIVGICLCPAHLAGEGHEANLSDIMKHIEYYYSIGGEDTVSLGSDLDGTSLPHGFRGVEDLARIADEMARLGYRDAQIEKLFHGNAERFIQKYV